MIKKGIVFLMVVCIGVSSTVVESAAVEQGEVPNRMQPNTVIIYDEDLNYEVESGGVSDEDQQQSSNVYACPGMKAVYDKNGLLRNVYYFSGIQGEYQLKNPVQVINNSGVRAKGSGKYKYNNCVLNFRDNKVTGKGQITYYGKPDNPSKNVFYGDHNVNGKPYKLKVGDCATKMNVDDIPYGIEVEATNTKNNKTKTYTKQDCGALPNAILDIFEDGQWSKRGICGLTVNGVKDSVDEGKISHPYKKTS